MKQTKPAQAMELRSLSPVFDGPSDVAWLACEVSVPSVPHGLEALEQRHAALVSLFLNLPSYVAACAAVLLLKGDARVFESFGTTVGWSIVLAPFLTGGAVAHAVWASRVGRVGVNSLRMVRATTALGILAVMIAVCGFLVRFAI